MYSCDILQYCHTICCLKYVHFAIMVQKKSNIWTKWWIVTHISVLSCHNITQQICRDLKSLQKLIIWPDSHQSLLCNEVLVTSPPIQLSLHPGKPEQSETSWFLHLTSFCLLREINLNVLLNRVFISVKSPPRTDFKGRKVGEKGASLVWASQPGLVWPVGVCEAGGAWIPEWSEFPPPPRHSGRGCETPSNRPRTSACLPSSPEVSSTKTSENI